MSYRKVPRKAIRYTAANPPKAAPVQQDAGAGLHDLSYRDLQERAKLLGISGKQTADALIQQIEEAEKR